MVFWCGGGLFSAPEAVQREKVGKIGKRLFLILAPEAVQREKVRKIGKRRFLIGFQFRRDVRHFFGAISWRVRPSLPWCFGVAEYWQKTIFNRVQKGR